MAFRTVSEQIEDHEAADEQASPLDASMQKDNYQYGGLVVHSETGERYVIFVGIIDILQSYVTKKKLEHTWKAMIYDGVRTFSYP